MLWLTQKTICSIIITMEFLLEIWEDLKNLFDPIVVVLKGLGSILAKVFVWLADLIRGVL